MSEKEKKENMIDDNGFIELLDENNNPVNFEFIHAMTFNETDYVVLAPVEDEDPDSEETGVVILRQVIDEDGNEVLEALDEDDELLDELFDIFVAEMEALEDGDLDA
ncbi:MAG: DUF1292 domain-containing protein [Clostridiales bacterium]|nr:DUF1292 domain-containing protein [Clostridiales bacterium]MBQ2818211.1 DUF1292 domain-containing protein [Clostridia bacterium]